jgi:hypothetical protein
MAAAAMLASGVCFACGEPAAVRAADAVAGLTAPPEDPPASTFVSAVLSSEAVVLAPFPPVQALPPDRRQ